MRLIDADALKDDIDNLRLFKPWVREEIKAHIDNAPTIIWCNQTSEGLPLFDLRERPKGEWKVYGKQGGIPITDMCSNCRYEMKWYKNKYNFCPNCGADMRNITETPSSCTTTNPNSVEVYHQSLKGGAE